MRDFCTGMTRSHGKGVVRGSFVSPNSRPRKKILTGAKHNTALARFIGGGAFALAFGFTALVARFAAPAPNDFFASGHGGTRKKGRAASLQFYEVSEVIVVVGATEVDRVLDIGRDVKVFSLEGSDRVVV